MDINAMNSSKIPPPIHPFYPMDTQFSDYLANDLTVVGMLTTFVGGMVVLLFVTYGAIKLHNPTLPSGDKAAILWNVLTGTIHVFFEGYFSLNHTRMVGSQDLFGQLWKEYALSDSRYLISDPFVLCMETCTAFIWGPMSFITAWFITTDHPLRHPLQALVTTGQMYGLLLYYATSLFDHYHKGLTYWRPEAYYFWIYYFAVNFIWVIIPGTLLYHSVVATAEAFKAVKAAKTTTRTKKTS